MWDSPGTIKKKGNFQWCYFHAQEIIMIELWMLSFEYLSHAPHELFCYICSFLLTGLWGTLHMVSEWELKRLGLLGSKCICIFRFNQRLKKINKFALFGHSKYLKSYPIRMLIELVVVQEKEEPLLRSQKIVCVKPTM